MRYHKRNRLTTGEYVDGILSGNRVLLSRAITLVESKLPEDNEVAEQVLEKILPNTGKSIRIGITGVPGVGKSTFIDSFGKYVTSLNKKLAVLAIDPSSQRSKGSILGDKTRMEELSVDPLAFIRPSATGNALGGVSSKTRESMLLCEAAGYDVIFIETVGVGQSETAVHGMVDFFLLLMLAGAGDELQGIKKGIMEMADALAITKADGDNITKAEQARVQYMNALHLFPPKESNWTPQVLTCSSLKKTGVKEIWDVIEQYRAHSEKNGYLATNRNNQNLNWMHETIIHNLENRFYTHPYVKAMIKDKEQKVLRNEVPAIRAARHLLESYDKARMGE